MPFLLSPDEEGQLFSSLSNYVAQRDAYSAAATPLHAAAVGALYRAAPTAPPGVVVAAGRQVADSPNPQAVAEQARGAVQAAAQAQHFSLTVPVKTTGGVDLNPFTALKTGVRTGLAAAQSGLEYTTNLGAQQAHRLGDVAGDIKSGDFSSLPGDLGKYGQSTLTAATGGAIAAPGDAEAQRQALGATTIAKAASNTLQGYGAGLGQGYLPSGFSTEEQGAAARQVRGTVDGHAWTLGRQLATYVVEPGTKPYQLLSGLVDATVAIKGDPLAIAGGKVAEARQAATLFKGVTEAELADEAAKAAQVAAGSLPAERFTIDPMRADQWLKAPTGQRVAQSLADDNSFLSVWDKLGKRVDPALAVKIAAERDPTEVANILRDELGVGIRSSKDINAASRTYEAQRSVRRFIPGFDELGATGTLAMKPGRYVTLASDATLPEKIDAVNNTDNFLKTLKVAPAVRSKVIGQLADSVSGTRGVKADVVTDYMGLIRKSLIDSNVDKEVANALTRFSDHANITAYGQRWLATGSTIDHLGTLTGNADISAIGPGLLSEGFGGRFVLPDARQINRLTSQWGRIVASGADRASLRLPFRAAENFQNVWKSLTVLRPATALRILGEEQVRMAANDLPSLFHHPLDYIMMVMGREQNLTAQGLEFNFEAGSGAREGDAYRKATRMNIFKNADDEADVLKHMYKTGQWDWVDRTAQPVEYRRGLTHTWGQLQADPFAAAYARGTSIDDMMRLSGFENGTWSAAKVDPEYAEGMRDVMARGRMGERFADAGSRTTGVVGTDYTNPAAFRAYLEDNIAERVKIASGGDQRVLDVIGHNTVGQQVTKDNGDLTFLKPGPKDPATGRTWVGSTVKDADGNIGKVISDIGGGQSAVVYGKPALAEGALYKDHEGTPLGSLLEDFRANGDSPLRVNYPVLAYKPEVQKSTSQALDQALKPFFSALMDKPSRLLSRSPVFRRAYYERMAELADRLAPAEANQLLKNIEVSAKEHGFLGKVNEYLGGDQATKRVVDAAGRANGTLKLDDLDWYAKGHALDETQNLLYDASRKRNIEDGLRIVAPFGQAYKEILTSWGHLLARNPVGIARRADQVVSGARGAGWFYTDPTTNQEMFAYPGSNLLSRFLTGKNPVTSALSKVPVVNSVISGEGPAIDNLFSGNVQGLNIAGNFLPTVGPVMQMPLSAIIPAKPGWEEVRALLLPYGESPSLQSTILPDWIEKVVSGIRDKPESNGMYGRMYVDSLQALAASGQYDPNDATSVAKMKEDAATKARTLLILRGLGQATLPASPQPDEKIHTQAGDIMASQLSQEFAQMEKADYQHAVGNFIDTYGEGPFLYAIGKTKSVNGGLSPSKAFGDWEASHGGFLGSYGKVGGFFGPVGDDFSMEVYQRQLDQGERVRLTDQQMLDAAQSTIARWKYNQLGDAAGPKPSTQQRDLLAQAKQVLQEQYPAFGTYSAYNPTELPAAINQLKQAATDPRVQDNPVAKAVNDYMQVRDVALQAARKRTGSASTGLGGAKMADLRGLLDDAALEISRQHPEFQRVWDHLLSREVDING